MIKKLGLTALLVSSAGFAMADSGRIETMEYDPLDGFYFGGDIGYQIMNYDNVDLDSLAEEKLPVLNVYAGFDFTENFAMEGGLFMVDSKAKNNTKVEEYGLFVDAVGKYAVSEKIDLLGTAGVQFSKGKLAVGAKSVDKTEFAPRLGLGLEGNITDKMKMRGMVRYTKLDYDGLLTDALSYTIGLNYKF